MQGSWSVRSGLGVPPDPPNPGPYAKPEGCLNGHREGEWPQRRFPQSRFSEDPMRKALAQSAEETELERCEQLAGRWTQEMMESALDNPSL